MSDLTSNLKPCPFCGGPAAYCDEMPDEDQHTCHFIVCTECGASVDFSKGKLAYNLDFLKGECSSHWNRRTPPEANGSRVLVDANNPANEVTVCARCHYETDECQCRKPVEPREELPEELFDSHEVWLQAGNVTSRDVTVVLDTLVKMIRNRRRSVTKSEPCLFDKLVGNPLDGFPSTKPGK